MVADAGSQKKVGYSPAIAAHEGCKGGSRSTRATLAEEYRVRNERGDVNQARAALVSRPR